MGLIVAAIAGVILAMAGALAAVVVMYRRQRRVMAALVHRLEDIESRWAASEADSAEPNAGDPPGPTTTIRDGSLSPSGDVLAGMTSQVNRLVGTGGGMAVSLADQAILSVYRHLSESVTPPTVAGELHVSLRTLERGLAVALGCTPGQLILAMKMREARRLLQDEGHSVSEVADRLGFANPFHFSRRFKSFFRVSPSEFCRTAREPQRRWRETR